MRPVPKPPPGDRPLKTLDRVLSKAGLGSRRDVRAWIGDGRVRVNQSVVRDPDHWVDLELDIVTFDGRPLEPAEPVYLLLNKPVGYLTTWRDPAGRPTVYDLMPDRDRWLIPVGRLDFDTSGLLLMTNDTAFAERVMNPAHEIPKTYRVTASPALDSAQLDLLRDGVILEDGATRPARLGEVLTSGDRTRFDLTITEGRNRQVRRMLEAVGSRVIELVRIAIGPIGIGDLPEGSSRAVTAEEIASLAGSPQQ